MKKSSMILITAICLFPYGMHAYAQVIFPPLPLGVPLPATAEVSCTTNENAIIRITFNGTNNDVLAVKKLMDTQIDKIKELAKERKLDKFELQSNNYNINSMHNNGESDDSEFRYNGNASFAIAPSDKAPDFMAILVKQGFHANLSVNSYRNGNCSHDISN